MDGVSIGYLQEEMAKLKLHLTNCTIEIVSSLLATGEMETEKFACYEKVRESVENSIRSRLK